MHASRRFRLSALLAGVAVIASTVLPALPAAAEEPPTPDPVVTSEATADPTPEVTPTEDPTPESTPTADPTPVETTPAAQPTATPTPAPTATATATATAGTVVYTGTAQQVSDDGIDINPNVVLFAVNAQGFLSVDISGLKTKPNAGNPVALTLKVPSGLTLSSNADAAFTQLATASGVAPLVALGIARIKQTTPPQNMALVNQTPNVPATHHIFAVYVSPSNKKVKDPGQGNNTAATALVNYADTYWSAQSGGNIHFALDGVVPWYQSTYSCSTQAGSTSLWSQALVKAKTAGYVPGRNNHLLLIFPNGQSVDYNYCGGAIGLGSVGGGVNQGGQIWVMGNTDLIAKETIAHELGHNMSLGHADWLACPSATPNVGKDNEVEWTNTAAGRIVGCTTHNYGDTADVMGFGIEDGVAGSLSSPQAIRAGIWPAGSWTVPPIGTTSNITLFGRRRAHRDPRDRRAGHRRHPVLHRVPQPGRRRLNQLQGLQFSALHHQRSARTHPALRADGISGIPRRRHFPHRAQQHERRLDRRLGRVHAARRRPDHCQLGRRLVGQRHRQARRARRACRRRLGVPRPERRVRLDAARRRRADAAHRLVLQH